MVRYFYDKGPRIFADVETHGIGSLMQINGCGRLCRCHGAGWRSFVSLTFSPIRRTSFNVNLVLQKAVASKVDAA